MRGALQDYWERLNRKRQSLLTFCDDLVFGFSLALVAVAILVVLFIACQAHG